MTLKTPGGVTPFALALALISFVYAGVSSSSAQTLGDALDTTDLVWTTGGDAVWFAQTTNTHDGVDAVQSPLIGSNQTSWIETTVIGPAVVSFWAGRGFGGDYAYYSFTVNGNGWPVPGVPRPTMRISPQPPCLCQPVYPGSVIVLPQPNWFQEFYDLAEGTNVLRWTCSNLYGSQGFVVVDEVAFGPARPLAIEWQPFDRSVCSGETAWLSVSAVGTPPLQYQWRKDGTNVVGGTNYFYAIDQATTNDSGAYSVTISNAQGFVLSSNAVLTVLPPTAPFFTYEPASATVYSGTSLHWWAGVGGSPPFSYQWRKDGTNIVGGTNTYYYFEPATTNDSGAYSVTVKNAQGFVVSSNAVLTVLPPTAPFFTYEPRSATNYSGESFYLLAGVCGSPSFSYQWRKDGTNIAGGTNYYYYICQATTNDSGAYSIIVSNVQGFVVSSNAVLTVLPPAAPFFTYEPESATVYSGKNFYLSMGVSGSPPFTYQWRKDGTNLVRGTNYDYTVEQAATNDSGAYSVTVSNAQGFAVSSNVILTVLPPAAPFFTYEPASLTAYTRGSFELWAGVGGSPPFSYQWRKDGSNLVGGTSYYYYVEQATTNDAGAYSVTVSNAQGFVVSSDAVVTVVASVAPTILRHPRSLEVAEGAITWLSCLATGAPDPNYSWTKEGAVPPPNPPSPFTLPIQVNLGGPTLSISNITTNDAGIYFATAANYAGAAVSREALVTVLPPLELRGSWWQGAADIFVTNGMGYLAQGDLGVSILNVSNPATPIMLGGYNTSGYASAVRVSDGLAFVADSSGGLQIISVTNPYSPIWLGGYNTPGNASDLAVRSDLVFVADGQSGLLVLNVTNPAAPFVVGNYSTNVSADRIRLDGNYAYVGSLNWTHAQGSTWTNALLVVDISNPAQPVEVARLAGGVIALDVRAGILFTSTGHGMNVIDARNPSDMKIIGSYSPSFGHSLMLIHSETRALKVAGDLAYLGCLTNGVASLMVLDIRDPQDPIPVGFFNSGGGADALWVDGHWVYTSDLSSTLQIIETPFNMQPYSPASLSLSAPAGVTLHIQGRRGINYSVESTDNLVSPDWQPLQTILLTNDAAVIEVPSQPTGKRFFRLRQMD